MSTQIPIIKSLNIPDLSGWSKKSFQIFVYFTKHTLGTVFFNGFIHFCFENIEKHLRKNKILERNIKNKNELHRITIDLTTFK